MSNPWPEAALVVLLIPHRGHVIEIVTYGATDENVTLECMTCGQVILTFDIEGELLEQVNTILFTT